MRLSNPFPPEVRNIWIDHWECADCSSNGNGRGGLELHHIVGRSSNATVNGVVVCHECHSHYGHSVDEEQRLFAKNLALLKVKGYKMTLKDEEFMADNSYLILKNPYLDLYGV